MHEEGEFADVGATVNAWLGGTRGAARRSGTPILEAVNRRERPGRTARARAIRRRGESRRAQGDLCRACRRPDARSSPSQAIADGSRAACSRSAEARESSPSASRGSSAPRSSFVDLSPAHGRALRATAASMRTWVMFSRCRSPTAPSTAPSCGVDALPRARPRARSRRARPRRSCRAARLVAVTNARRPPRGAARAPRRIRLVRSGCRSTRENGAAASRAGILRQSSASTRDGRVTIRDDEQIWRLPAARSSMSRADRAAGGRSSCRSSSTGAATVFVATTVIRPAELIQRKRDGEELADDELAELDPRLRARRGARLPDGRVLHGRLLPRPLRARDVRADRRDDPRAARRSTWRARSAARSSTSTRRAGSATRRRSRSGRSSPPAASRSGR